MLNPAIRLHQSMRRACRGVATLALALLWVMSGPLAARAAVPAQNMTLLGSYGGAMNSVVLAGDTAYIGQGAVVAAVDASTPAQPQRLGQSELLPGIVTSVAISQSYVYATLGEAGLAVLDVSEVATPTVVSEIDTPGIAGDSAIVGNLLLIADGASGLRVYNLSNPAQPTLAGTLDTPGSALRLVAAGNRVYIAGGSGGLRIVDITTPATPHELGAYDTADETRGVAYSNNLVYMADYNYHLRVVDVSNPAQPVEESVVETFYALDDVALVGDDLYVRMNGDLFLFTSNPAGPSQVGSYGSYFITDVAATNDFAFVTDSRAGLHVLDVNPGANLLPQVALLPSLSQTGSVAVRGNLAYAPDDFSGFAVIDVSQPAQMEEITRTGELLRVDQQVAIVGDTLIQDAQYIVPGGENRRLYFFSLTNPAAPQATGERGVTENYALSQHLATRGDQIFVADDQNGALILDANAPTGAPLGVYDPEGYASAVAAAPAGDTLIVIVNGALHLIDVSTPGTPQHLGELAGSYTTAASSGNLAFAYNTGTGRLEVINIQNPASPQVVGSIALPGNSVSQILTAANLVWVANVTGGVWVLDVSQPTAPIAIASFDPPGDVLGLALDGDTLYVAANDLGLLVLQRNAPTALDESDQPLRWRLVLPLLAH